MYVPKWGLSTTLLLEINQEPRTQNQEPPSEVKKKYYASAMFGLRGGGGFCRVSDMKKNILILSGFAFVLFAGVSCRQHDYRTLVVSVPEMRNQACVYRIGASLWSSPALKKKAFHPKSKNEVVPFEFLLSDSVRFNVEGRQITIMYDSLLAADKNLEFRIAKAGFEANGIPADKKAAAALPPECRR